MESSVSSSCSSNTNNFFSLQSGNPRRPADPGSGSLHGSWYDVARFSSMRQGGFCLFLRIMRPYEPENR
jgi:hypothetical protein